MPHPAPLRSGDPGRVGRYQLTGRLDGIPSDDPIFIGAGPDGMRVAITVLSGDWALDAAARDRFAAEAAVAKRVPPFCAARVLDAGLDGSQAYLVSEYIQGPSLLEQVSTDGVRRAHDLEAVAIGMATGLASVHQAGLVHGSFGPEFVIMAPDGSPRVVEFGITPPYGAATPSADMLAWAQTVVFAASGRPPATLDDLDVLPDQLRDPVARCLDPEPAGRPAARAVVQSLLGTQDLPAGVLAEGSRRAVRPARGGSPYAQDRNRQSGQAVARPEAARPSGSQAGASETATPADDATSARRAGHLEPAQPVRHANQGSARRRTGWLVSGTVLVVIVVAVLVSRALLGGGSHASDDRLSANTGTTSGAAPSAGGSAAPSAGGSAAPSQPVAPAAFAGAWTGVVTQPPTDTYNVTVTLTAGATTGTISYVGTDFSCSGALTITQANASKLVVSQGIIQGQSDCENGQATITLSGTNKIWFSFHSSGPIASGTLAHQ
jgi:eukaryotic-like serine/threonine-protein kinase